MKILLVTDLYPVKSDENTPKTLYNFVSDWQKTGHQVDVVKPNFLLNSFLRSKPLYKTGQYGNVFNVNYFTPFLGDVKKKLSAFDYDVIVAHMPSGIMFSNHLSGKLICAVHCSDIEVLTNPIYSIYFKPQMEKAYERASAIACRSFVLRKKFLELYPQHEEKTFTAPSGVNVEPVLRKFNRSNIKILTCANLIPRKNLDKLIHAVKGFENMTLTVIGDGKMRKKLEKIDRNVVFTDRLPHEQVLEYMRDSDIFVLPSVHETFGMVYLEAMSQGCITVCTENDGIDGIIKHNENGFLTLPTVDGIKNTITQILDKDENSLNSILKNCYNTVNQYTSAECSENYLQNILKII